jgi:hypothetical protein
METSTSGAKLDFSTPSTEELINLKETAFLFKSNLFKLQLNELLHEVILRPLHFYMAYLISARHHEPIPRA